MPPLGLSILIESLATALFSVMIYSVMRILVIEMGFDVRKVSLYYWLFFTGYYKHSLSYFLGLSDYLNTQWSQTLSRRMVALFYSSVGTSLSRSWLGSWLLSVSDWFQKLVPWMVVLMESFLEAFSFVIVGLGLYYGVGLRGIANLFVTSVSLYLWFDWLGLHIPFHR